MANRSMTGAPGILAEAGSAGESAFAGASAQAPECGPTHAALVTLQAHAASTSLYRQRCVYGCVSASCVDSPRSHPRCAGPLLPGSRR